MSNAAFPCPHCGRSVPSGAGMCRGCGADKNCGWNDEYESEYSADDDGDDFDYDRFVAREFPDHSDGSGASDHHLWVRLVVLVLVVSFVLTVMAF